MPEPETRSAHAHGYRSRALAYGMLAACCLAAYWLSVQANRKALPLLHLSIDPAALDLGTVWESEAFEWTLPLTNTGAQAVEISGFAPTCGCLSVEPAQFTLAPGQATDLKITVDLTAGAVGRDGKIAVRVIPHLVTAQPSPAGPSWTVSGTVRPILRPDRPRIDLGEISDRSENVTEATINISDLAGLRELRARCASADFVAVSSERVVGEDAFEVRVAAKPGAGLGIHESTLILEPVGQTGEALPERRLKLSIRVVEDLQALPRTLSLGNRRVGERVVETVALCSLTRREFAIESIHPGADTTVEPVPGGEPGNVYQVSQTIKTAGDQTAALRFGLRADDGSARALEVPVRYYGVPQK